MLNKVIEQDTKAISAKLFGSRSMAARTALDGFDPAIMIGANIDRSTDWDFSQQYTKDNHNYLVGEGYTTYNAKFLEDYADDLTIAVYEKQFYPKINWGKMLSFRDADPVKIHIVLHSDEELFRRVWDAISPEFYYEYIWKRSPRYANIDNRSKIKSDIRTLMNQLYKVAS